ncbi:MAG: ATP-dependent sacrificial sulfur transferase LarE [Planctomycetota bacterium]|nr:ATP-dependent sacrificial sulfur transferase LarE [Planctomycetota bacterium]
MNVKEKYDRLIGSIRERGSLVVAFSGGVDSTLLLYAAKEALCTRHGTTDKGQRARGTGHTACGARRLVSPVPCPVSPVPCLVAVTARSCTYPRRELAAARRVAESLAVRHIIMDTDEMSDPRFAANPRNRCFYCKSELFDRLRQVAARFGIRHIADGTNADDLTDVRPGRAAAAKFRVISPLLDAGLTKADIRILARKKGLPNWHEPAHACLASRLPYGTAITPARVRRVEKAEEIIVSLGFRQVRVRDHSPVARIEVSQKDLPRTLSPPVRRRIVGALRRIGYPYVTIDLQGYRTGSMNESPGHRRRPAHRGKP